MVHIIFSYHMFVRIFEGRDANTLWVFLRYSNCVYVSHFRSIEYHVTWYRICYRRHKTGLQCRCTDVKQCNLFSVMNRERLPLLFKDINSDLSLLFATLCVIDIFGVFPIIALPRSIVQCGKFLIFTILYLFSFRYIFLYFCII